MHLVSSGILVSSFLVLSLSSFYIRVILTSYIELKTRAPLFGFRPQLWSVSCRLWFQLWLSFQSLQRLVQVSKSFICCLRSDSHMSSSEMSPEVLKTTLYTCFARLFIFHDLSSTFQSLGPPVLVFQLKPRASLCPPPSGTMLMPRAKPREDREKSRRGLRHLLGTTASLIGEEGSLPQSFRCLPAPAATARRPLSHSSSQDQRVPWSSLCLHLIPSSRSPATLSSGCGMPEKWSAHYLFSWISNSSLLLQSTCCYLCSLESSNSCSMHAVRGV